MSTKYTGRYQNELAQFVQNEGGIVQVDFRYLNMKIVESAFLVYDEGCLNLLWNDKRFTCFTNLTEHMFECGVGVTNPDGSLFAGNAANAIFGNYNIFSNSWVRDHSLSELVSGMLKTTKDPKTAKSPFRSERQSKVSKADQRIMRPENGKAVWSPEYLKAKGINHAEFLAKHGKDQVYNDLKVMTVIEFETKYSLR